MSREPTSPHDRVADVALQHGGRDIAVLTVHDGLEVTDAQIGSLFVTSDDAKTVLGQLPGRAAEVVVDGRPIVQRWERMRIRVPLRLLSRWQRHKLLWAPTLRRVRVRFRRHGAAVRVQVRRRWPR